MSVESQMMKEGAGARGVIGPLEGCFCLSHWKALMLFGLIGSNIARGWLASGVKR